MTEFIYLRTDERVTTKNNVNNLHIGDYLKVKCDDGISCFEGVVENIEHEIRKWHNGNGLERSTHDIKIVIR